MSDGVREVERIASIRADVLRPGHLSCASCVEAVTWLIERALTAALAAPAAEGAWRDGVEAVAQLADKYAAAYRDSPLAATTARRIAEDARALAPRPSPHPDERADVAAVASVLRAVGASPEVWDAWERLTDPRPPTVGQGRAANDLTGMTDAAGATCPTCCSHDHRATPSATPAAGGQP